MLQEVISKRGEFSKTYALGKNKYRYVTGGGIIHWKNDYNDKDEQWKEPDLTMKDGQILNAPYVLTTKNGKVTFTYRKTLESIELTPDKLDDYDIVPFCDGVKVQKSLKDSKKLTQSFGIKVTGNSVKVKARAQDADGDELKVKAEIKDGVLTETIESLEIDKPDGSKKQAKFPIKIDPELTIQPSGKDTYISSYNNSANYGTSDVLYVGWQYVSYPEGGYLAPLIQFLWDSDLVDATITDASLELYNTSVYNNTITVARLLRLDWVEAQATWSIYKTGSSWTTAGARGSGTDYTTTDAVSGTAGSAGWISFDVTNQVQTATDSELDFAFRLGASVLGAATFYSKEYATDTSKRPKLVIDYEPPSVTVTPTPGAAETTGVNPTVVKGSIALSPAAGAALAAGVNPVVILSSITITPTAGAAETNGVDPSVVYAVLFTPDPGAAATSGVNPTVIYGSIAITPAAGAAETSGVNPTVLGGGMLIIPEAGAAVATGVNPVILFTGIVLPSRRYRLEVRDSSADIAAYLENAFDIKVEEQYNQLPLLSFRLPVSDSKVSYCSYGNEVWLYIDDSFYDCYRMDHFTDSHRRGELVLNVEAVQAGDRLNEDIVQDYSDTDTIEAHATALLALQKTGSQVSLGGVDSALNLTREFSADGMTIWEALLELRKTVGGIIYVQCNSSTPTTRTLWIKESIGEAKGQQIRYRKNLNGITRDIDYKAGVYANKLYPYGTGIQLDDSPITDTPAKSADATYGYLTLPLYSCYKNWTAAGNACPSGMLLLAAGKGEYKSPSSASGFAFGSTAANSIDGDTGTFAFTDGAAKLAWTPYAQFNLASAYVSAVKFYAATYVGSTVDPYVEIGVYDGSDWETVFIGTITKETWIEKTFTGRYITAYRIRFYNDTGFSSIQGRVFETEYFDANLIGDWKQGAKENVIRALLADYDSEADYELTYTHAPYLRNVDATKEISATRSYDTTDIETLRGLGVTDMGEIGEPYTTYTVQVADLSQQIAFEFLKLGSLVTVIDEDLTIAVETRIVKLTRYLDKNRINVDLSNAVKTLLNTIAKLS